MDLGINTSDMNVYNEILPLPVALDNLKRFLSCQFRNHGYLACTIQISISVNFKELMFRVLVDRRFSGRRRGIAECL